MNDEGDRRDSRPSDGTSPSDDSPSTDTSSDERDGAPVDRDPADRESESAPAEPPDRTRTEGETTEVPTSRDGDRSPPPERSTTDDGVPSPSEEPIRWYLNSTNGFVMASRDIFVSIAMVALIALVLFAISGVWPPLVAVESGSMEPNMKQGDLVLIVDNERFAHPDAHEETGIITSETGESVDHESFGQPGNVIVFQGDGEEGTPIIHRAKYHVDADEDWYHRADQGNVRGYSDCLDMPQTACPAPQEGFVTKGDDNGAYDQLEGQSTVVKEEWIQGKAVARVPWLGCIRLELTSDRTCLDGRN